MMKYFHYRVETRENRTQMSSLLHSWLQLSFICGSELWRIDILFVSVMFQFRKELLRIARDKSLIRLQSKMLTSQELMASGGGPALLPYSCEETRPAEQQMRQCRVNICNWVLDTGFYLKYLGAFHVLICMKTSKQSRFSQWGRIRTNINSESQICL